MPAHFSTKINIPLWDDCEFLYKPSGTDEIGVNRIENRARVVKGIIPLVCRLRAHGHLHRINCGELPVWKEQ
jgi:hypothetical protein